jgi:hypothetical protein
MIINIIHLRLLSLKSIINNLLIINLNIIIKYSLLFKNLIIILYPFFYRSLYPNLILIKIIARSVLKNLMIIYHIFKIIIIKNKSKILNLIKISSNSVRNLNIYPNLQKSHTFNKLTQNHP